MVDRIQAIALLVSPERSCMVLSLQKRHSAREIMPKHFDKDSYLLTEQYWLIAISTKILLVVPQR